MPFYVAGGTSVFALDDSGDEQRTFTVSGNNIQGLTFDGTNLWLTTSSSTTDRVVRVAANTADGTTLSSSDQHRIVLPSTISSPAAVTISGTNIWVLDSVDSKVYRILSTVGNNQTATIQHTINLPTEVASNERGIAISDDGATLFVGKNSGQFNVAGTVAAFPSNTPNDTAPTDANVRVITFPNNNLRNVGGLSVSGNNLYVLENTADLIFRIDADTADGTTATLRESITVDSDITAFLTGVAFEQGDATLTIATTDTNLYTGKVVEFNITADVDISDFAASDITVTGGTRGTLTMTDARNFVLSVTLGAVGNLNIAIGEDVVSPGNAAVDADFTIVARVTVAIAFDDDDVETSDSADATVTFSEAPEGLDTSDFSVNVGTIESVTGSGTTRTVRVTAPSSGSGTITLTLAADSIDQGNLEASDTIDYAPPSDALTVAISGTTNIEQGEQTTLAAAVTNPDGLTITSGLTYAWTASRGSFPNGATGASVTYEADFSESSDVDVDITCTVTRTANANPTVSTGSLTAMADLGITGQILNMYIDETEASANGSNTVFYAESSSDSSLASGSDDDVSSTIHIWRVQWHASNNWFILNANGTGNLSTFFSSNTAQSIYVVFSDGTYYEITNAEYDNGGSAWARWAISDADIRTKFDNLGADDTLLVGVGAAGAIGYNAGSGSGEATVTATASDDTRLTISTDETNLYAGKTFDIDITADADISDFVQGDVSITGGTINSLTETDAQNFVLNVTAGNAGTMTVSIAANAVTPNNVAVSQDFTIVARATATITSNLANITENDEFTVTIQWDGTVDNLINGDVNVTNATKGTFTAVDGDTYTLVLTADAGSGTITVSIPENSVDQGNAAISQNFTYTEDTFPDPPTAFTNASKTHNSATFTWSNPTDTGGTDLTDVEFRITTGSTPGGTWQSLGVVETHTESGLTAETEYTAEVRAKNSEGTSTSNPNETFTTSVAPGTITIEDINEQFITVGTENYELEVEVYGNPTNAYGRGVYEGFSAVWDPDAPHAQGGGTGIVTIKIPEAVRLTMDQVWTVHADTVMRDIIYNVVPAAPVITDPGTLTFFRGVNHNKFIQVSNSPDTINVDGDLVGLTHNTGVDADQNSGVFVSGEVLEDDDFGQTDFGFTVETSNATGDDDLDVSFTIEDDKPTLIVATADRIYFVPKETADGDTAEYYGFNQALGGSSSQTAIAMPYNPIDAEARPDLVDWNYIVFTAEDFMTNYLIDPATTENTVAAAEALTFPNADDLPISDYIYTLAYAIEDGKQAYYMTSLLNNNERIYRTHTTEGARYATLSAVGLPDGIAVDDTYLWVVDGGTVRRYSKSFTNASTISASLTFTYTVPSGFSVTGMTADSDDLYVLVTNQTTQVSRILVMDKNTANNGTATVKSIHLSFQGTGLTIDNR